MKTPAGLLKGFLFCSLALLTYMSNAAVTGISPKNIIGGIAQLLTINGSGFGATRSNNYVSFKLESGNYLDVTNSKALNYRSWSDTKIELEMPVAVSGLVKVNIAGTDFFSADTLKVKANLGYRTVNPLDYNFFINTNSKGGYTWYMHRAYWNNPAIKSAIEEVFRELRCKTGVNYILAGVPSDATLTLGDNINLIAPDSTLGAVGYTDQLWGSCVLGAITFYKWSTMDVRMSTTQDWFFGTGAVPAGKSKFRYVLMHELGHSLGLGHVNEPGQTMYPSVTLLPSNNWNARDTITTEEQTAIRYMVNLSKNFSFNACGITPMLPVFNCNDVYGLTSGIAESKHTNAPEIFPNPNNGKFYINSTDNITIYNIQGEEIPFKTEWKEGQTSVSIDEQPKGIYVIKVYNGKVFHTIKISKL